MSHNTQHTGSTITEAARQIKLNNSHAVSPKISGGPRCKCLHLLTEKCLHSLEIFADLINVNHAFVSLGNDLDCV